MSYHASLARAAEVARQLQEHDSTARKVASNELTEFYNEQWTEYENVKKDGTFETVLNPIMTQWEFENRLTLSNVIIAEKMVAFFFVIDDFFRGTKVAVES